MAASLLPGRLPQFLIGALIGIAVREGGFDGLRRTLARSRWTARGAVVGLVTLGLYVGANGTYHRRDVALDLWIEPLSALFLGILLLHLVVREEDGQATVVSGRAARGAGLVSYSLYLWHYPILAAAVAWLGVAETVAMAVPAVALGLVGSVLVTLGLLPLDRATPARTPTPERRPAERPEARCLPAEAFGLAETDGSGWAAVGRVGDAAYRPSAGSAQRSIPAWSEIRSATAGRIDRSGS